ncbi:hypothetical protein [Nocardia africana]
MTWKDLLVLAAPLAAIVVAWMTGRYSVRNSKKSPYDRLDMLVKLRTDWPDGVDGRSSVDNSIAHALAQIRAIEGDTAHPAITEQARRADKRVAAERRKSAFWLIATSGGIIALYFAVWVYAWDNVKSSWEANAFLTAVVGVVSVTLVLGIFGLFAAVGVGELVKLRREAVEARRRSLDAATETQ